MTSLGNDLETHTYGQGYGEEHLRPINAVTHLFKDGDLDTGHHRVMASAAKECVARKKPFGDCELLQVQEHQLEAIAMTNK
jgi:hypothetical protein